MEDKVIRFLYYSAVCSIHEVKNENYSSCLRLTPHRFDEPENYALTIHDVVKESCLSPDEKQQVLNTIDSQSK